jgi:hypothetical protein
MPVSLPLRGLGVLWAADLGGHLRGQHLAHHGQADRGAHRQQPLTRDARDRAQRQVQFLRQLHRLGRFVAIDQTDGSYVLLHRWWSPSVVG